MSWKPTNQVGRYDRERVARLDPIKKAIDHLKLPLLRMRLLRGILNAIEMQIESGGDNPDVNHLLAEALRTGVRHQVDDNAARPILRAIDVFERTEAKRWGQVKAGTLPPVAVPPEERLQDLIEEGATLLESKRRAEACDRWLEAWEIVKHLTRPELRTTDAFDKAYPGGLELVFNWCQELERELGNAGFDNPTYHEQRVRYAREFLERFPDEDANLQVNFGRAQGEALWHLGRIGEAESVFAALVSRVPDDAWGYIGWSDQLWLFDNSPKEYAQAEAILQRALARPEVNDREAVLERLDDLHEQWGKPGEQATTPARPQPPPEPLQASLLAPPAPPPAPPILTSAPAVKPARNAPCWCGSGRKYKRCHLAADESAQRRR
jgi:tetratricopeptide (TPR) repeat protein